MHCSDGAGVDVFDLPQWAAALPRQKHSWVMVANGRTAWVRFKKSSILAMYSLIASRDLIGMGLAPQRLSLASMLFMAFCKVEAHGDHGPLKNIRAFS